MKILTVAGTRPEDLKLAPVEEELRDRGHSVRRWMSGQSPDLVDSGKRGAPMMWEQGLSIGASYVLKELHDGLRQLSPDALLVVGDTATAFAGAVAGFLAGIPVGHVEAGLRTYEREPWPEEAFRGAIARFANLHFCPDEDAADNVLNETIPGGLLPFGRPSIGRRRDRGVYEVGNPSIDALGGPKLLDIVATFHRRENWGERIEKALDVLNEIGEDNLVEPWVFKHPNWVEALDAPYSDENGSRNGSSGSQKVRDDAGGRWPNVRLLEPTDHPTFLQWLRDADIVVTDSGGVQEECAALGTDCLVYRTATERKALENLDAVEVVDPRNQNRSQPGGSEGNPLRQALQKRVDQRTAYGRGNAAAKIADILEQEIGGSDENP